MKLYVKQEGGLLKPIDGICELSGEQIETKLAPGKVVDMEAYLMRKSIHNADEIEFSIDDPYGFVGKSIANWLRDELEDDKGE